MALTLKNKEEWLILLGALLCCLVLIGTFLFIFIPNFLFLQNAKYLALFIFNYCEIIGIASLGLFPLSFKIIGRRPFTHVPPEGSLWEYVVMGFSSYFIGIICLAIYIGVFAVLPILVPLKVIYVYTLSTKANLVSALVAIPIIILSLSFAFSIVNFVCMVKGKGMILFKGEKLLNGAPLFEGLKNLFYFSLLTMLGNSASAFELEGWCRWVAVIQSIATKIFELVILGVAIGLIVNKTGGLQW